MALAMAHALELPGKMRLSKEAYFAAQTIYYPGFTIGGAGEPLSIVANLLLLIFVPPSSPAFAWNVIAFVSLLSMHVLFWAVTQPVNRHWVSSVRLGRAANTFFSVPGGLAHVSADGDWERWRKQWEYSHLVRSILAVIAFISLTIATPVYWRG
jgi:hypothetical protein